MPGTRQRSAYFAASEGRNYFVTRLVAEIAENYYGLMALDARLENLDRIIALQERSLEIAKARKEAARGTELPVQRFQAEVRKNQSEKLIVKQDIIQVENRINFLLGRFPQPVERKFVSKFIDLNLHALSRGSARAAPSEPTRHPPSRARAGGCRARREGRPGHASFLVVTITGGVGYEAFNPRYLFITPEALIGNVAGWPDRAVDQLQSDQGRLPHRERQAIADRLQLPARRPQRLHRG